VSGIFLSYRREHTGLLVDRLHDRLATRFGPEQVFRDVQRVDPRDDFGQRLDEVVGSCDALLAVLDDRWLLNRDPVGKRPLGVARDWVQREIETAMRRPDVLVIPVLVEGATMPGELEMPFSIRSLSRLNPMRLSDAAWDAEVERLLEVLGDVVQPPGAPSRPAGEPTPPEPTTDAPPAGDRSRSRWFRRR
jgi:hypothetical protein